MGDHTETIQIEYDPEQISYESLLHVFWSQHDPTANVKRQYMSAIFYHNDQQKLLAEGSLENIKEKMRMRTIRTQILPAERFYDAEDYHQKYILRQNRQIFKSLNLSDEEVISSPLASKLTGFLGGFGGYERLDSEIDSWDLNEMQKKMIRQYVMNKGCNGLFCSIK